ncbi:MAG: HNH endonuclease [Syntrophaceae bacterium]|nr:HNH endonuclease [Syntrophaceae bacterium]
MPDFSLDAQIRLAAFKWLHDQRMAFGETLHFNYLRDHFYFQGRNVSLVSNPGIFKPRGMDYPISIRTAIDGPYNDRLDEFDNLIQYSYRKEDRNRQDNIGLQRAMRDRVPLIYLHGVVKGWYMPVFPVYIVGDNPATRTFTVQPEMYSLYSDPEQIFMEHQPTGPEERRYIITTIRQRLHQSAFRERVIKAYQERCAVCRLHHRVLLDAAHIIPDSEGGPAEERNGLSLCKLHHAAFDRWFFSVRPDYSIEVRKSILEEDDGPMLRHGLKEIHNQRIQLPRDTGLRPDRDFLDYRYQLFSRAH